MKALFKAASLAAVVSGAMISAPAFASGATPTTVTVTANTGPVVTGHAVVFRAAVAPAKVGAVKITGTVAWTVTGHDGSTVPCGTTTPLSGNGISDCRIGPAQLLAGASPYTATATYSGDANFGASTGSTSETVTAAVTKIKIIISVRPTSGASTVVQADVHAGPGSPDLSGNVTFAAVASFATKGVKPYCSVPGQAPSAADNSQPLVNGVATCTLPAGWFVVPTATSTNKRPESTWAIAASFGGNASFDQITTERTGYSKV